MSHVAFLAIVVDADERVDAIAPLVKRLARRLGVRLDLSLDPTFVPRFAEGAEVVGLLGSASAPFDPPATIELVRSLLAACEVSSVRVGRWSLRGREAATRGPPLLRVELRDIVEAMRPNDFAAEVVRASDVVAVLRLRDVARGGADRD